ncbi:transglycosylase SLT domain-containing protein [Streptomyces sp. TRM72054]|uniref:transglycosylase SLT domain-containing protein n=1 Tax=Streptomyces sp. TRM72054 TaxID=2870562 RepID=UPI0021AB3AB9|nr:transglycosylase SLT domain-containing protein [Streptomyces sp. TRM72054]
MSFALMSKLGRMVKNRKYSMRLAVTTAAVTAALAGAAPLASADSYPGSVNTCPGSVDTWINQSLQVMQANGIPGSYDGICRNLMRESSGDPGATNMWDSNAQAGHPSKGLMQVIDPTFQQYHVDGTSDDIYDPVANIVAACNYAAHAYGSIDNVNSAY